MRTPTFKDVTPKEAEAIDSKDREFREAVDAADSKAFYNAAGATAAMAAPLAVAGPAGVAAAAVVGGVVGIASATETVELRVKNRSWRELLSGSDAKMPSAASSEKVFAEYCTEWSTLKCSQATHFVDLQMSPVTLALPRSSRLGDNKRMVATMMDFIPDMNIAQFTAPWVMCMNILNPVVLSLSLAKAAVTGTFSIVPYPCCLSRINPSPWVGCNPTAMVSMMPHIPGAKAMYETFKNTGVIMPIPKVEFPALTKNAKLPCIWPFGGFDIITSGRNDNPVPYNAVTGLIGPSILHCIRNLIAITLNFLPMNGVKSVGQLVKKVGPFVVADALAAGAIKGFETDAANSGKDKTEAFKEAAIEALTTMLATAVSFAVAGAASYVVGGMLSSGPRAFANQVFKDIRANRPKINFKSKGKAKAANENQTPAKDFQPEPKKEAAPPKESGDETLRRLMENSDKPRKPEQYDMRPLEEITNQDVRTLPGAKQPTPRRPKVEQPETPKPQVTEAATAAEAQPQKTPGQNLKEGLGYNGKEAESSMTATEHMVRGSGVQAGNLKGVGDEYDKYSYLMDDGYSPSKPSGETTTSDDIPDFAWDINGA